MFSFKGVFSSVLMAGIAALPNQLLAQDEGINVEIIRNRGWVLAVSGATSAAPSAELALKLKQEVTVDFQDVTIRDVTDFIYRNASVNLVLDPEAEIGAPPITFAAKEMDVGRVLDWVAKLTNLEVSYVGDVVYIGTEPYQGKRTTTFYDVTDLVTPVQDFPGPDLSIKTGGASFGAIPLFEEIGGGENNAIDPDELADIIEDHLNKGR